VNPNNYTAGFFGKLPAFADFIKHNSACTEISIIDNWIQEGLTLAKLKYRDEWKSRYDNCPPINFIFPFTETENLITGLLRTSIDKSGRSFPVIFFLHIKKSVIQNIPIFLLPPVFNQVLDAFNDICYYYYQSDNINSLKSAVSSVRINLDDLQGVKNNYNKFLSKTSAGGIFQRTGDDLSSEPDYLKTTINLTGNVASVSYRTDMNGSDDSYTAGFFIELLQKVIKSPESLPGLFWTAGSNIPAKLFIMYKKPNPGNFIDIILSDIIRNDASPEGFQIFRSDAAVTGKITLNEIINSAGNYLNQFSTH